MMNRNGTMASDTEPWRYALRLLSAGPDRIRLLFEIRTARPDLSLSAAKALLDRAPAIVKDELLREDVEQLHRRFKDLALVEIVQSNGKPLPQQLYETSPTRPTPLLIV